MDNPGSDATQTQSYLVKDVRRPAATILIADAYGDAAKTSSVHAYTLDGPTMLNNRWGTNSSQCPADPRHSSRFNALFGDGHVDSLSMKDAGYDADFPEDVGGTGDPSMWNGLDDENVTAF